jgi:hypothetical protein
MDSHTRSVEAIFTELHSTGCHTDPCSKNRFAENGNYFTLSGGQQKRFDLVATVTQVLDAPSCGGGTRGSLYLLATAFTERAYTRAVGLAPNRGRGKGLRQCPSVLRSPHREHNHSRGSEVTRTGQLSCDRPDTCDEDGRTRCCWCWACGRRFIGKLHSNHAAAWTGHSLHPPSPHMEPC